MKQFVKAIVSPNIEKALKCDKPKRGEQISPTITTRKEEGNYIYRTRVTEYEKGKEVYHDVRLKNRPKQ